MMAQLLCHLWGDYVLQSDWMAQNKRNEFLPAWIHAEVYSFCFLPLAWNHGVAFTVILVTHFLIDRYGLARYLVWAKNWLGPKQYWLMWRGPEVPDMWQGNQPTPPWRDCKATGYPPGRPAWLVVWLTIIADNTLHLTINYLALKYL